MAVIARVVALFPITWCSELESRSWGGVKLYVTKFASDLWQVGVFYSGSSGFLDQYNLPQRYSWNIVERGVKHHHANKKITIFFNVNFLGFHVDHQTTKVDNTRDVIVQYHHNHKYKMSTNISLSSCQNVNEQLTIRLSKYQRTSHYPVTNMSTNSPLSGYQNVREHRTILSSKCQGTSHYPFIKMSTNLSLSGY